MEKQVGQGAGKDRGMQGQGPARTGVGKDSEGAGRDRGRLAAAPADNFNLVQ